MNVGFVNLAIAEEDRVQIHSGTTARLFENLEVAIIPARDEKCTEAQNPCILNRSGRVRSVW